MEWPSLLSPKRHRENRELSYDRARPPWQQDYDRIVFSSAFRRLQDKTQVHPLSGSDYIRTRLTHSLEVASVARSLGTLAGDCVLNGHSEEPYLGRTLGECLSPSDVGAITGAAALAHDIGNPPFGHSGEDAIRYWFETSEVANGIKEHLTEGERRDLENWDGNAEGLRILARMQMYRNQGGMRLTVATMGAYMKYAITSEAFENRKREHAKAGSVAVVGEKKPGIFSADREEWDLIARELKLDVGPVDGSWARHPLAYLTEAADDICYRIVDLEDGFRLGCVTFEEFRSAVAGVTGEIKPDRLNIYPDDPSKASYIRAIAINVLVGQVASVFRDREAQLLEGKCHEPLLNSVEAYPALKEISSLSRERVYASRNVLQIEAAGYEILPGLLDAFVSTLEQLANGAPKARGNLRAAKLAQLMPRDCFGQGLTPAGTTAYLRLLDAVDFVAGMTDTFALDLYRKIRGVTIPR